jgi:predicted ATPase with chaperone activity
VRLLRSFREGLHLLHTCPAERRGVTMVSRYQKRISAPLLDRSVQPPCGTDIRVESPPHGLREAEQRSLGLRRLGEPSAAVRVRVEAAREQQQARFVETSLVTNADSAQPPRQGNRPGPDPPAKCPLGILPGR